MKLNEYHERTNSQMSKIGKGLLFLCSLSLFVPKTLPAFSKEKLQLQNLVGQVITITGSYSIWGKLGTFVTSDDVDHPIYIIDQIPKSRVYTTEWDGQEVTITAKLQYYPGQTQPISSKRTVAVAPPYYYFNANEITMKRIARQRDEDTTVVAEIKIMPSPRCAFLEAAHNGQPIYLADFETSPSKRLLLDTLNGTKVKASGKLHYWKAVLSDENKQTFANMKSHYYFDLSETKIEPLVEIHD